MKYLYPVILFLLSAGLLMAGCGQKKAENPDLSPKVNQLGYYPDAQKFVIVPNERATSFQILKAENDSVLFTGDLSEAGYYEPSGETVKVADFSAFRTPGSYRIQIEGGRESFEFEIGNQVFEEVTDGVLKAFYFMRASTPLAEEYAGKWARKAGHPDTSVMVHASAATDERPEGTIISSPKGWYDAGDYNKYVVNSGISTFTLLFAYEQFPDFFETQSLNIPESDNELPDILDETLWNLRWLLTMQDPNDGGVYHKLTTASFEGGVMPHEATNQRFVVKKNTPATLDFAGMMAQAARVYRPFLPEFADSALQAAKLAWEWAEEHPEVFYRQRQMNEEYDPDIITGAYGDRDASDERFWAGAELFITSNESKYYDEAGWKETEVDVPSWGNVRALGLYSLVHHRDKLTGISEADKEQMIETLLAMTDDFVEKAKTAPYRSPFGLYNAHFFWGSNGHAGNIGMAILQSYQLTGEVQYYESALRVADYLLGMNPVGYSYITGYGDKQVMNIHHRPSYADGIEEPVPGLVAGGANPGNQNQDCGEDQYPSTYPALSYLDNFCSYSTNEITINWNAPVVYLFSGLEYLRNRK